MRIRPGRRIACSAKQDKPWARVLRDDQPHCGAGWGIGTARAAAGRGRWARAGRGANVDQAGQSGPPGRPVPRPRRTLPGYQPPRGVGRSGMRGLSPRGWWALISRAGMSGRVNPQPGIRCGRGGGERVRGGKCDACGRIFGGAVALWWGATVPSLAAEGRGRWAQVGSVVVCADQARAFGRSGPGSTNPARELSEVTSCILGPGEPLRAGQH